MRKIDSEGLPFVEDQNPVSAGQKLADTVSVVALLLKRDSSRKTSFSFGATRRVGGALNRYFVSRSDRNDFICAAIEAYIAVSGAVLMDDGRIVVPSQKTIDFEPFNEGVSV